MSTLCEQNLQFLDVVKKINRSLAECVAAASPAAEISALDSALDSAVAMRAGRNKVLDAVTKIWYESWQPRVVSANGRTHDPAFDSVKDHLPMRTSDMSYLVWRELLFPVGAWATVVAAARNSLAAAHALPTRKWIFDWNLTTV